MTAIVINECFGGFNLSADARRRMREIGWDGKSEYDLTRDDARLVQVVEELGTEHASGSYAHLVVVTIPDGVEWHVHEYDGYENVHEAHRVWDSSGEGTCS